MLRKLGSTSKLLRLPPLLLVLLATLALVTALPAATGDTIADRVLGQPLFTVNTANFVDGAGLNFLDGFIGDVTPANGVAVDSNKHLYIADTINSRILGWENADSFSSGQPADLVIGQADMFHNVCAVSESGLCFPTGVAVDANGDLYIADFENSRVVEYSAPYAAYADQACSAASPCENKLMANLVFGQPNFVTATCNQNHPTTAEQLCDPEGVSVNPTTGDLYVADTANNRVLAYLNPLASRRWHARNIWFERRHNRGLCFRTAQLHGICLQPEFVRSHCQHAMHVRIFCGRRRSRSGC